ncbi:trypsin-like peptidase domain-containing protein [Streptomyces sp. NPDC048650]|uniref:trypsin-like peptidase domain-containing protein n=1 Tax=Streptomyces sp. NPDC048650 TaxID=3365583 RepID=UPI0037208BC8
MAEIIVSCGDEVGRRGSGYLVAMGRVLTSAHVVNDAHSIHVRFDADLPTEQTHLAEIAWANTQVDIAVLSVLGEQKRVISDFGRVTERDAVLQCSAMGFPLFKMRIDHDGSRYRDACHAVGTCAVLSNRREGTLDLRVAPPQTDARTGRSPWEGMSGAAVFSGNSIIGVVARHHLSDGPGHLAVLRADRWHEQLPAAEARRLEDTIGAPLLPARLTDVWCRPRAVARRDKGAAVGQPLQALPHEHALALEVHPAIEADGARQALGVLPPYLHRSGVDDRLHEAVSDAQRHSKMVMLVGGSSTGKTWAAWEAVRSCLPDGWRLWHPLTPDRPISALEALRVGRVGPRTVIWLNESQLYLSGRSHGEEVSVVLQELLTNHEVAPVLILGSLWPSHWRELTAVPTESESGEPPREDPHAAARVLLSQATVINLPDAFAEEDLLTHKQLLDSDPRLTQAATSAGGHITQFLAGAPELIRRYQQAPPPARAVAWAAMDARRLGHGPRLPREFIERAASAYLTDDEWDALDDAWFDQALAYLASPCRGTRGPLSAIRPRPGSSVADGRPYYRLADYLEQHGTAERRHMTPPAGFWEAAFHAATPQDARHLADSARLRWRLAHAAGLYAHAARNEDGEALHELAELRRHTGWDPDTHQQLEERAEGLDLGTVVDLLLTPPRHDRAYESGHEHAGLPGRLLPQEVPAADGDQQSDAMWAMRRLEIRQPTEGHEQAAPQSRGVVNASPYSLAEFYDARMWRDLAPLREAAPVMNDAEDLETTAVAEGNTRLLFSLALIRELAGDLDGAEAHLRRALRAGHVPALSDLVRLRRLAGDHEAENRFAFDVARATDAGSAEVLPALAARRIRAEGAHSSWTQIWRFGLTAEGSVSPPW